MTRRNGFTLLEVLVALVVLGFLMAGLTQGVRFGLQAWGMQTRRIGQQADMDATFRALRRLIQEADPGEGNQNATVKGGPHTLSVTTRLPRAAATSGVREAEVGLGVDAQHRLMLRAVPHPHAERLGPPVKAAETVLLDRVDHIDFAYWRATGRNAGWVTAWTDPTPPGLVKMHVAFDKNDKKHWPDLIAEPMRDRLEE